MDLSELAGGPKGPSTLSNDNMTPEQIATRDRIFNAPLPQDVVAPPYKVINEFNGEITYEQRTVAPTSLTDYKASKASAFNRAFAEDSLFGAVNSFFSKEARFEADAYAPTPGFDIRDHMYAYDAVLPEFYGELNKSQSVEELVARAQYFGKISKDLSGLDQMGAEGVGYRVAAFMSDLPMYDVLSFAGLALKAPQLGRFSSFANAVEKSYMGRALVAGSVEGGFEATKLAMNPNSRDEYDIMLAVALGGVLGGFYKPATYTQDVTKALTDPLKNLKVTTDPSGKSVVSQSFLSSAVDKAQINVASVLSNSPSKTLRDFGDNMFLNVTQKMSDRVKAAEVQTTVIDNINHAFNNNFSPLYKQYLEETGRTAIGRRYRLTAQDDFYELVGKIANQPNKNWEEVISPELLAKIRKANDNMATESYDILARNGHDMFTSGEIARGSYLPRRWNRGKLVSDIATGVIKNEDAYALFSAGIKDAVRKLGLSITDERAVEAGKKFVETLKSKAVRTGEANYIMEDNAFRTSFDELAKMLDLTDSEHATFQAALQARREQRGIAQGTATSTKHRATIDIEAVYTNTDGMTYNLSDYVENNVQNLWHSYGRQMGGDTALRSMGIIGRPQLGDIRNKIVKELSDTSGQMSAQAQRDLVNFDAVVGDLLGITGKFDPENTLWKATRLTNNLTRAAKLGSTWFSMSAELAQVVHVNGVVNTFKHVPILKDMVKQLKTGKASGLLEEIQGFYGLAGEILQMPAASNLDDLVSASARGSKLATAEALSSRAAEAIYMLGGTKSGTSALEALFAAGANNKVVKLAGKTRLSKHDYWYLEQMGFKGDMVPRLLDSVRSSGAANNKYILDLANWADQDLAMKFAYGVRRVSNLAIQRGNIGDQLGKWTIGGTLAKDNVLGSLGLNLRNYMITAWNKQFSRMVGQFDRGGIERWEAFRNIVYQGVIVGGLGYMGKQGLNYVTGVIDEDKYNESMTPQAIASNTFSMVSFSSLLPIAANVVSTALTGKNTAGKATRGNDVSFLGASGSYLADVANIPNVIGKAFDSERNVTEYEIKKTLGLLPLSSLIGVQQGISALAKGLTSD